MFDHRVKNSAAALLATLALMGCQQPPSPGLGRPGPRAEPPDKGIAGVVPTPAVATLEFSPLPDGLIERGGKIIREKDGMEMVKVPAGEFAMGTEDGSSYERPVHTVYLDEYYIDKFEVTVAQVREFCPDTGRRIPKQWDKNKDTHPVMYVSWEDAAAYAKWAGAAARRPVPRAVPATGSATLVSAARCPRAEAVDPLIPGVL